MKKAFRCFTACLVAALMLTGLLPLGISPTADAAVSSWDGSVSTSFSGSGTAASPYIIDTAAKLAGVAYQTNNNNGWSSGKYFVLTVDIDLGSREWTPIGIQRANGGSTTYSESQRWFCGYFDGNGHVVRNVRVGTSASRSSVKHVGLFGIIGGSAVILNMGVETASYYINHYCDDERVGGFVGYCKGVIQGCYARNVTINQNGVCVIGGFCGQATSESTIYKSYAYNVSLAQGSGRKGGFVGDGNGTVAFSFVNYYPFHSDNGDGSYLYSYGENNVQGTIVGNGTNTGYGPESFMSGGNNGGWPQLIWQSTGPLDYNTTDGYVVSSAAQMRSLACFVNNGRSYAGAKIALKADVDLSAYDWAPIGIWQTNRTRAFSGTFNGGGYIVSNMKLGTSSSRNTLYVYKGLFGYTDNAVINCVGVYNAQIYGNGPTDYRCGALVGQADGGSGKIYQCFVKNSTVNMTGTGVSGVTVGDLRHNLTDCYTLNSSAAGTRAGSVVGDIKSTLYNVYSGNCTSTTGSYTSENKGTPVNCYHNASAGATSGYVSTFNSYSNRTNYTQSAGAWITDVYNINGGYACLKWEPRFSISFNGNGGTISGATPVTGRYQYTATTPSASRTGYTFKNYYTAGSGGTSVIGQSATFTFGTTKPSDTARTGTLYAQWTAKSCKVILNGNGATTAGTANVTATYDSAMPNATMPTKTGYTFLGYYDTSAATGGTQYYTATGASARTWNKDTTADTTLWARWTPNTDTVYNVRHYQMKTNG
ncbi:MAG: InlB B-repeat-containing protein, partial [Clostridia bacterium]|nr:InlB B-repeat-containing protein [Clostridia bacterium]